MAIQQVNLTNTFDEWRQITNTTANKLGDLASLTTSSTGSAVQGINSVQGAVQGILTNGLQTTYTRITGPDAETDVLIVRNQSAVTKFTVDTAGNVSVKGDLNVEGDTTISGALEYSIDYPDLTNKPVMFSTVAVSGQSSIVADDDDATLTVATGQVDSTNGLTITTNAASDTITFKHADTSTLQGAQGVQGILSVTVDTYGHVTGVQSMAGSSISIGSLYVAGSEVINSSGEWTGDNSGLQGVQGAIGAQGAQGIQGRQGANGSAGSQGVQGIQGIAGFEGSNGTQGATGATGAQGIQGIQGITGAQGIQGRQGIQGGIGADGSQGIQGRQGTTGAQGIQGITGPKGDTGLQGTTGSQGIQGRQGTTGTQGTTGSYASYTLSTSTPTGGSNGDVWFQY